ncbi:MarR family transcriptional regulator [Shewanella avicenniae]|uniref:MarR family transcriptional regulator n=1 Tax=Shewanella avicenniae TaxID=2814294 RepID=A0ABX7QQK7_9GAMM|nr:MarR family transcriptional regulator [Shewanella avicenniae]QSX33148.1 MarR family transcriptional regulator [Shewanella avicenniae]
MTAEATHLREYSLVEHLGRCQRLWRMVADAELAPLGLTHPRWTALWKLKRMGDGVSQKQLAESLEIELPSLMRTLGQLEEQGLVTRVSCTQDKRARIVNTTEAGRQVLAQLESRIVKIRAEMLQDVSSEQLKIFEQVLSQITQSALDKLDQLKTLDR